MDLNSVFRPTMEVLSLTLVLIKRQYLEPVYRGLKAVRRHRLIKGLCGATIGILLHPFLL